MNDDSASDHQSMWEAHVLLITKPNADTAKNQTFVRMLSNRCSRQTAVLVLPLEQMFEPGL